MIARRTIDDAHRSVIKKYHLKGWDAVRIGKLIGFAPSNVRNARRAMGYSAHPVRTHLNAIRSRYEQKRTQALRTGWPIEAGTIVRYLEVLERGPAAAPQVAAATGIVESFVRRVLVRCVRNGWAIREWVPRPCGRMKEFRYSLAPAVLATRREYLALTGAIED